MLDMAILTVFAIGSMYRLYFYEKVSVHDLQMGWIWIWICTVVRAIPRTTN